MKKQETTTHWVSWNLLGHEGNISSATTTLVVNKVARITRAKFQEDHQTKVLKITK